LFGANGEEAGVLLRWLGRHGVRLVRSALPWAEPAMAAGSWSSWLALASTATMLEQTVN
jgi:DNA polymerase-3 subunit epsilon